MGLYDRDYMREDYEPEPPPPRRRLWVVVVAVVVAFSFLLGAIL